MGKPAEIKTKETSASVTDFINSIDNEQKRRDSYVLLKMMEDASKQQPKMWGSSIIGFGKASYKSPATGKETEWPMIGFSPRKTSLSLYLLCNLKVHAEALKKLGKHKTGVGCLYINKLDDIDLEVLKRIITTTAKTDL